MKDTITQSQFINAISHKDSGFSYGGAKALFEHLTQYEEDYDQELDFDPVAFRCEYDEYENLKEVQDNYKDIESLEDLRNNTTVIEVPNSEKLIVQGY